MKNEIRLEELNTYKQGKETNKLFVKWTGIIEKKIHTPFVIVIFSTYNKLSDRNKLYSTRIMYNTADLWLKYY